jgi:5-methylcytosine-specific restriction endonuclease McrA
MRRHSRDYFGGNRESVLYRDQYRCQSCGAGDASVLHVHHRRRGVSEPGLLITVCSACHARLHRLASIHVWIPELLAILWAEQHPDSPVQLQLAFGMEA